jgi:hypothetical protein
MARKIRTLPPPRQRVMSDAERQALVEEYLPIVHARLVKDFVANNAASDAKFLAWLTAQPPTSSTDNSLLDYGIAKQQARDGNLEPLRKIVAERMNDPEIVDFIERPPPPPPGPRGKRKDYARFKPLEESIRRAYGEAVGFIREILKEITGKEVVDKEMLGDIAAECLKISYHEIRELIHDGYTATRTS